MAIAVSIKLTAAIVAPAMVAEIAFAVWRRHHTNAFRSFLKWSACWAAAMMMVLAVVGSTLGRGSLQSSLISHFAKQITPSANGPADHFLPSGLLLGHADCILLTVVGVIVLFWRKRWCETVFPVSLLFTTIAIHAFHRPWWNYYYLHLAIPFAWLAGIAVQDVFASIATSFSRDRFRFVSLRSMSGGALAVLLAYGLAGSEARLQGSIQSLRRKELAAANPIVVRMKQYGSRTRWVYAESVIYPFHAALVVPPDLAVVMSKRVWSGQITPEGIVEACERYRPEQIVLPDMALGPHWTKLLNADYVVAGRDDKNILYVNRGILAR